MLKLFSTKQLQEVDQFTIENEPIKSIDLMERAAKNLFSKIKEYFLTKKEKVKFAVFCGIGNNGGDGLAIARMLYEAGFKTKVFIVQYSNQLSENFKTNLTCYKGNLTELNEAEYQFDLEANSIIIDALFGSGLNRPITGFASEIIQQVNQLPNFKIAIDLPSGLFVGDNSNNNYKNVIQADWTLSIQLPKLAFLFPENERFTGSWNLVDIGLSKEYIEQAECKRFLLESEDLKSILKTRMAFSHKGTYGHAILLAGSEGKMGAAVLAARACLRSGVGLLSMQVPKIGEEIIQTTVPEAMVLSDLNHSVLSELKLKNQYSSIAIGPGIGVEEETQKLLKSLIQEVEQPMVIDADGLNILSENKTWLSYLSNGSILSPHPGEFKRLVGAWSNDFERLELQVDLATKTGTYVILKGKNTSIATPAGKVFFNSTGNPGMATGGSGDVLTGMLSSFLAQGYTSLETCLLGVYLHGLAGDLASEKLGEESMIASDIIEYIPKAFKLLKS